MSDTVRFKWTDAKLKAAAAVADDEKSEAEIAAEAGVDDRTVRRWKQHPAFIAKVNAIHARYEEEAVEVPIARRSRRVINLNERLDLLERLRRERAEAMDGVTPGGGTGLLLEKVTTKTFKGETTVEREFALDAVMLREMREHEKQAAQELGQWTEKREVGGKDGGPIDVNILRDGLIESVHRARQAAGSEPLARDTDDPAT